MIQMLKEAFRRFKIAVAVIILILLIVYSQWFALIGYVGLITVYAIGKASRKATDYENDIFSKTNK